MLKHAFVRWSFNHLQIHWQTSILFGVVHDTRRKAKSLPDSWRPILHCRGPAHICTATDLDIDDKTTDSPVFYPPCCCHRNLNPGPDLRQIDVVQDPMQQACVTMSETFPTCWRFKSFSSEALQSLRLSFIHFRTMLCSMNIDPVPYSFSFLFCNELDFMSAFSETI